MTTSIGGSGNVYQPQNQNVQPHPHKFSISNANALVSTISDTCSLFFTKDFLTKKMNDWIKSKALPLSTPDGLKKEIAKANKHKLHQKNMLTQFHALLKTNQRTIDRLTLQGRSPERLAKLKDLKILYQERIKNLGEAIKITDDFINQLNFKQKTTIISRLAGPIGSAADVVYPGIKPLANVAITAATASAPVVKALRQPNFREQRSTQRSNHWSIALTALSFVGSTAASYYVWPVVNDFVNYYFFTEDKK